MDAPALYRTIKKCFCSPAFTETAIRHSVTYIDDIDNNFYNSDIRFRIPTIATQTTFYLNDFTFVKTFTRHIFGVALIDFIFISLVLHLEKRLTNYAFRSI